MIRSGTMSPWGAVQDTTNVAEGIQFVETASHGGVYLSPERNRKVPGSIRNDPGWYEEDSEWTIAAMVFPEEFRSHWAEGGKDPDEMMANAIRVIRDWHPEAYQAVTGEAPSLEESRELRRLHFEKQHAEDYVAIAAMGGWDETTPYGFVRVVATRGGDRSAESADFLVPDVEYTIGENGFVIDENRHIPWEVAGAVSRHVLLALAEADGDSPKVRESVVRLVRLYKPQARMETCVDEATGEKLAEYVDVGAPHATTVIWPKPAACEQIGGAPLIMSLEDFRHRAERNRVAQADISIDGLEISF